jgi:hypothetical protein
MRKRMEIFIVILLGLKGQNIAGERDWHSSLSNSPGAEWAQ